MKVCLKKGLAVLLLGGAFAVQLFAQSSNQSNPTPVTTNEIAGAIKSRDVGDARLTTYYYTFEGDQGDLFVNVLTRNFTGDVDVYAATGLRPLTKIVVYADIAENETGRVIYLRKPEKIILRVQGRSPGDDDASFRIKFAGSFVASKEQALPEPEMPKANVDTTSGITVNSVGTIIAVRPKPTPTPAEVEVAKSEPQTETIPTEAEKIDEKPADDDAPKTDVPKVVVTEGVVPENPAAKAPVARRNARRSRTRRASPPKSVVEETAKPETEPASAEPKPEEPKTETRKPPARTRRTRPAKVDPVEEAMANVRLVISFKDGSTIERPMNEVYKFGVERGTLTVISKDGRVGKYSMIEISKVTIE